MTVPADLTRVMNNARVHVAGAHDDVLKLELFNVLTEFMKGSHAWKDEVRFTTISGRTTYELVPNESATIVSLFGVEDQDELPVKATMPVPGTVELASDPGGAYAYVAEVALTVVDPVNSDGYPFMPDWLLARYYDVVLAGVIGAMFTQPAKPWTNERLAIFHTRRFRNGIAMARREARVAHLYEGQNWRFPSAVAGSQR